MSDAISSRPGAITAVPGVKDLALFDLWRGIGGRAYGPGWRDGSEIVRFFGAVLCSRHHTWGHMGSFHELGRTEFERRYGINLAAEVARFNSNSTRESKTIAT
jgi:hypothetical protein